MRAIALVFHCEPAPTSGSDQAVALEDALVLLGSHDFEATIGLCPDVAPYCGTFPVFTDVGIHHHGDDGYTDRLTDLPANYRGTMEDFRDGVVSALPNTGLTGYASGSGWETDRHRAQYMSIPPRADQSPIASGPTVRTLGAHPADRPVETYATAALIDLTRTLSADLATMRALLDACGPDEFVAFAVHPLDHAARPGALAALCAEANARGVDVMSLQTLRDVM